jgi:hypothetical protein
MRYANRRDTTHSDIKKGLVKAGFSVADTSRVGDGFPDLIIGKFGVDAKVECKTPRGRKTALERLGAEQREKASEWKGSTIIAAYCLEDVLFGFSLLLKRQGWVR